MIGTLIENYNSEFDYIESLNLKSIIKQTILTLN